MIFNILFYLKFWIVWFIECYTVKFVISNNNLKFFFFIYIYQLWNELNSSKELFELRSSAILYHMQLLLMTDIES